MPPDLSQQAIDPARSLIVAVGQAAAAGFFAALLAGVLIWWLCTRGPGAVPPDQVWVQWRRRWFLWAAALITGLALALLVGGAVVDVGLDRDAYWWLYPAHFAQPVFLAAGFGYLGGLLLQVIVAIRNRRRGR